MDLVNHLFTVVYCLMLASALYIGYHVGRGSKTEDLERISEILTKGVYEETQPKNFRTKRVRWNPRNLLNQTELIDPIEPEEQEHEPLPKKGGR